MFVNQWDNIVYQFVICCFSIQWIKDFMFFLRYEIFGNNVFCIGFCIWDYYQYWFNFFFSKQVIYDLWDMFLIDSGMFGIIKVVIEIEYW